MMDGCSAQSLWCLHQNGVIHVQKKTHTLKEESKCNCVTKLTVTQSDFYQKIGRRILNFIQSSQNILQ